jgi:hypothetical protein
VEGCRRVDGALVHQEPGASAIGFSAAGALSELSDRMIMR